jgi:NADH-ubiquinone oxidoreductase chain 5
MEGPTPVSALIHAATMVTAGVYLVLRCSFLFELCPAALNLLIFLGALTVFFGSLVGLTQFDIKKVIAYSTCSQLGYMLVACGLSNYNLAAFHLVNHAFIKALLFLSAGVIITRLQGEQDFRKMGGLQ